MSAPSDQAPATQGHLRLVFAMAAVYSLLFVMAQMHRMGGAVVAPALSAELSLRASDLGLVIGAMFFASAATQPVSGILLDRVGPVRAVAMLAPLAVGGMLLFAWTDEVWSLTLARAMIGSGFACVVSGIYVFLLGWVPRKNFTTAAATIQAIPGTVSVLVATTPLAILLAEVGRGPVFTGLAVLTAITVVFVCLAVKEGPLSTRKSRQPESIGQSFAGILMIIQQRRFLWLAAFSVTAVGPAISVIGLLSGVYLHERFGLDASALGTTVLVLLIALNLGGVIYGPLDRWTGRRKAVVTGGILVQISLLSTLAILGDANYWITLVLLTAFASVSQLHALVIAHAQSLFGPELAGRVITTTNIFMIGGIFLFQTAAGSAYDYFTSVLGASATDGYRLTFAALAACQVVGLAFYSQAPVPRER
jgi:MFS family permease